MANYCATTRTNYFRVKNANEFRSFMENVYAIDDDVHVWEENRKDGSTVFGFGCYGQILGIKPDDAVDDEDFDYDYDAFVDGLSGCVADDDAVIIMEAGYEKLRYVVGNAMIITSKDSEYLEIQDMAMKKAAEMLHNSGWTTQTMY